MRVSAAAWLLMLAAFAAAPAWAQSTNQLYMTGTGSGNAPAISANGVDTNINMALMPKGTGYVGVGTATPAAKIHDTGGIIIGPDAQSCASANNGELQYTSASSSYSYCNGSAWIPFDPCHSVIQPYVYGQPPDYDADNYPEPSGLYSDGTYFYVGETGLAGDTPGDMLLAFTFNTSSHAWALSSTETSYTKGDVQQVFVQNGLIWTIESNGGPSTGNLQTWTYSVPNFTLKATATGLNGYDYMAGDGTYVYVADQGNGLKAYQGSGTTLTKLSTTPYKPSGGDITAVFAQGGKIIVSDAGNCNTLALTYSGGASFALSSTLTGVCNMGQDSYGNASDFPSITGDGTYIYIADTTNVGFATANVYAYTLSGTTWTKVGTLAGAASGYFEPNFVFASSAQPGIVYVQSVLENCPVCAFPSSSVFSYSFNGSTFTFNGTLPTYAQFGPVLPQYTDGSYLYYPDTPWDWAMAFPVCR